MEQDKTTIDMQKYVRPLLRRKWLWIIPTIIFSIGFAHNAVNKPDIYESRCVMLLEKDRLIDTVLEERGAKPDIEKVLASIRERMLGWEPVVKIIRELGLDKYIPEDDPGALEALYTRVVQGSVLGTSGRGGKKIVLTHRGVNPEECFGIVEAIASNFMEQAQKLSQDEANETIAFIEEDLRQLRRKFDESERKLRTFEEEHRGELPADNNISRLSAAENELVAIDRETMILQEKVGFLEDRKYMNTDEGVQIFTLLGSNLNQQIIDLEIHIETIQARYSDEHPEVIMRKNELAQLKEALEREYDNVVTDEGNRNVMTEQEFDMQLQLKSLQRRGEETESLIASLSAKVKNMPNYNQEYYELQKEYNINRQLYEQRLFQKSKADLVKKISYDSKASLFTIVEHPRIPNYPLKAKKISSMLMGLVIGAGLGIGMIFGLERTDQRFKTIGDVQGYLQVPALGVIPTIITKTDVRKRIKKRIILFSILTVCVAAVISVCFVVQPVKGIINNVVNDQVAKAIKLVR